MHLRLEANLRLSSPKAPCTAWKRPLTSTLSCIPIAGNWASSYIHTSRVCTEPSLNREVTWCKGVVEEEAEMPSTLITSSWQFSCIEGSQSQQERWLVIYPIRPQSRLSMNDSQCPLEVHAIVFTSCVLQLTKSITLASATVTAVPHEWWNSTNGLLMTSAKRGKLNQLSVISFIWLQRGHPARK